jgi:protein SCO1/2
LRTPPALIPYLLAVVAVLGGLLWHLGDRLPASGRSVETGTASVGGPFLLRDQNGILRTEKDFAGRYELIYFGYSFCPDVCPTTLSVISDALAKLGTSKSHVVAIFITLDPGRDRPSALKVYLNSFGPDFVGLTGNAADIKRVADEFRVYFRRHDLPGGGYAIDHTSVIYLMDGKNHFVTYYDDTSIGPDKLAKDLRERLR